MLLTNRQRMTSYKFHKIIEDRISQRMPSCWLVKGEKKKTTVACLLHWWKKIQCKPHSQYLPEEDRL